MLPYFSVRDMLLMTPYKDACYKLLTDHAARMCLARGSSHNHQAWEGGYLDHVSETMNAAVWLYWTCPRELPFSLADALLVMFLHDLEKPWKHATQGGFQGVDTSLTGEDLKSKQGRKNFRNGLIKQYGIELTPDQETALRYVEGVPDSEYTPGERTMGELAAFCHMCDIASARLWHDYGKTQGW